MENDVQPHPYWFFSNIGSFPVKVTPKIYKVSICNIRLSFPTSQSNVIYKQLWVLLLTLWEKIYWIPKRMDLRF